jgi:hypothetical protein
LVSGFWFLVSGFWFLVGGGAAAVPADSFGRVFLTVRAVWYGKNKK